MSDENKPIEAEIVSESPSQPAAVPRASEGPVSVATAPTSGATDTGHVTIKKRGWPKGKPRKTAFQRLDVRKQRFVVEVLAGKDQTSAAIAAGYSPDPNSAKVRGNALMNNPKVQNALQEKLDRIYPNLTEKVADRLMEIMEKPIREGIHGKGISVSEFLATANFLKDVYGWKAPTKHFRLNASAKVKRLLPSD
jgi:hypothetical protein